MHTNHIKMHGVAQFINLYNRCKDRECDKLLWGDEIEYMLVSFDDERKQARLSLRGVEVLQKLQRAEEQELERG